MKTKKVLTILLLVFVAGSVAYMIIKEALPTSPADEPNDSVVSPAAEHTALIVYYFHGDFRCITCNKLESYTREAVKTHFVDAFAAKKMVFMPINTDKPQNSHFIQDYGLVSKSVVLSEVAQGREIRFKNLDQIWQKVADKDSYLEYIRNSIAEFLEETNR